jgi:hypothetical protein
VEFGIESELRLSDGLGAGIPHEDIVDDSSLRRDCIFLALTARAD